MSAITLRELPSADKVRERLDYDPETGIFLWKWRDDVPIYVNSRRAGKVAGADSKGYRQIKIGGSLHRAHRLAWLIVTGEWPTADIDHINGDPSDNRISNLRVVTHAENQRNKAIGLNNTSGVMGVDWIKARGKWRARVKVAGRNIHIGYFSDIADAIAARLAAEITYGYHENHGRKAS
jgi:hypothetical protein